MYVFLKKCLKSNALASLQEKNQEGAVIWAKLTNSSVSRPWDFYLEGSLVLVSTTPFVKENGSTLANMTSFSTQPMPRTSTSPWVTMTYEETISTVSCSTSLIWPSEPEYTEAVTSAKLHPGIQPTTVKSVSTTGE